MKRYFFRLILSVLTLGVIICSIFVFTACGGIYCEEYDDAKSYAVGDKTYSEKITSAEIYWMSGSVTVITSDEQSASVIETGDELSENKKVRSIVKDGKIIVRFWASGYKDNVSDGEKNLTVTIPKSIDVTINAKEADVSFGNIEVKNLNVSTTTGKICADSVSAQTIDLNTDSGTVEINIKTCSRADIETKSGNVSVKIPVVRGAWVTFSTKTGKLITEKEYKEELGIYIFGSGGGDTELDVKSTNGNLTIR